MLITTQGEAYRSRLTPNEKELFDAGGIVTQKYQKEGKRPYSSFQPPVFIKELIGGKFQIREFIQGNIRNTEPSQDSWVLRKS